MREIKFRGWFQCITGIEYWVYGYPLKQENGNWEITNDAGISFTVDEPEQYTGLKDKKCVEIYEGDIVKIHSPCIDKSLPWKQPTFKRIGWHNDGCWNLFNTLSNEHKGFKGILNSNLKYYTVVGNIHENPELLNTN